MGAKSGGDGEFSRRSFIKTSAGVATGAAIVGAPAAAVLSQGKRVVTEPSTSTPREPIMAYVRDADRGEVTVLAGTRETTYRDPALVKQLLAASPRIGIGGGADVLAP
jgi:hypothetical protein